LVGTSGSLRDYFYQTPTLLSVANRLHELPEVARLEPEQCRTLILRGLEEILGYDFYDVDQAQQYIAYVTDRVPQFVHEYCLVLAEFAELNGRRITREALRIADRAWLQGSLVYCYSVIESHMNVPHAKVGRRDQTLFALGMHSKEEFTANEVQEIVRREFKQSSGVADMGAAQALRDFCGGTPLLRTGPKPGFYRFADPRYRMALRVMLRKNVNRVEKVQLQSL
jgi:hypothetical protein